MRQINRKKFFDGYRAAWGPLKHGQVAGLEQILGMMEKDADLSDLRHAAYMLATVKHECADFWAPIIERGTPAYFDKYEPGTRLGVQLGNKARGDGARFKGRGYVQITGLANYARLGALLGLGDALVTSPESALDPEVAYRIMSVGMRRGAFTGRKLAHYFTAEGGDYINARRIINSLDCAQKIADYAQVFEAVLRESAAA